MRMLTHGPVWGAPFVLILAGCSFFEYQAPVTPSNCSLHAGARGFVMAHAKLTNRSDKLATMVSVELRLYNKNARKGIVIDTVADFYVALKPLGSKMATASVPLPNFEPMSVAQVTASVISQCETIVVQFSDGSESDKPAPL